MQVVFDGSVKTASGVLLNDILMVKIQTNLFAILLLYRSYLYGME